MDNLTARLQAEKRNRPSGEEMVTHNETLRRMSEELDLFLSVATGARTHRFVGDTIRTSIANGHNMPYRSYDVGDALTRSCL